ncbi:MAG: hypothetical protein LBS96_04095 [Oscillospiraceae bacterium]|jgi:uncharacterized ion transporter superfamily protein YfcC|nr:hypothetical protein [Oscillospiraceae bacterium]
MKNAEPAAAPAPGQGDSETALKLNKKTILIITALLLGILLLAGVLTQVVPRGAYALDENGAIINGTYQRLTDAKLPVWRIFTSPVEVFLSGDAMTGVAILLFIVLVGGTFLILEKSLVIATIMSTIVQRFAQRKYTLLALITLVCMALGSVVGILEESITLVPLAAAIALALGWDSLTGLGISLVAVAMGYSAATFNPFNVVVVQTMAGLPLFSGLGFRLVVFVAFYAALLLFLTLHAKRVERKPESSITYQSDLELRKRFAGSMENNLAARPELRKAAKIFVCCISGVLVCAALSFVAQMLPFVPEGVKSLAGYLPMGGMALLFTLGGILAGRKAGLRGKALAAVFWQGVKTVAPIAPLLIFVMSITFLLKEGKIIDTILHAVYENVKGLEPYPVIMVIFALVVVMEFFIGSGTAKAFLIMPILLPLADMLSVTRQVVVVDFSLADGVCNILYPTSGVMIIAIGLINVSYGKFLRWTWKLFLLMFALSALLLWVAQRVHY